MGDDIWRKTKNKIKKYIQIVHNSMKKYVYLPLILKKYKVLKNVYTLLQNVPDNLEQIDHISY